MQPELAEFEPGKATAVVPSDGVSTTPPSSTARNTGVELARGIAAFGVIVVHSHLVVENQVTPGARMLWAVFESFVVPFFLAAALYYATASLLERSNRAPGSGWLRLRAWRILLPYAAWTAIYTGAQAAKFLLQHDSAKLQGLTDDLPGRILFGGSGMHLYFLPLLLVGFAVARLLVPPLARKRAWVLVLLSLLGLGIAELTTLGGTVVRPETPRALAPLLSHLVDPEHARLLAESPPTRVLLVLDAHALHCLPYVLLAVLFATRRNLVSNRWMLLASAVLFAAGVSSAIHVPEALIGFSGFILALASAPLLRGATAAIALNLGALSFAIFLMHQLLLQCFQMALAHHRPASAGVGFTLAISALTFLLAWIVASLVCRLGNHWLCLVAGVPLRPRSTER